MLNAAMGPSAVGAPPGVDGGDAVLSPCVGESASSIPLLAEPRRGEARQGQGTRGFSVATRQGNLVLTSPSSPRR